MNKEITKLEESILLALLKDIEGCSNDAIDMFKAQERLKLFNEAMLASAQAEHYRAKAGYYRTLTKEATMPEGGYQ